MHRLACTRGRVGGSGNGRSEGVREGGRNDRWKVEGRKNSQMEGGEENRERYKGREYQRMEGRRERRGFLHFRREGKGTDTS